MQALDSYYLQSSDYCATQCQALGMPVMALYAANGCSCGSLLPSPADKVDSSKCNTACYGYPQEMCECRTLHWRAPLLLSSPSCLLTLSPTGGGAAGSGYYNIFLTGSSPTAGTVFGDDSTSPSSSDSSTSSKPSSTSSSTSTSIMTSVVTSVTSVPKTISGQQTTLVVPSAKTIIQTISGAPSDSTSAPSTSSGHSNGSTIGIAVGVVVGLVALVAILGGALFYCRRRRRAKNAENGHARAESLNAFVASGGTLPGIPQRKVSITDSRLDPRIMVQTRRQSAGSVFADNQDYSRRILKVANPDDS